MTSRKRLRKQLTKNSSRKTGRRNRKRFRLPVNLFIPCLLRFDTTFRWYSQPMSTVTYTLRYTGYFFDLCRWDIHSNHTIFFRYQLPSNCGFWQGLLLLLPAPDLFWGLILLHGTATWDSYQQVCVPRSRNIFPVPCSLPRVCLSNMQRLPY